MGLIFRRTKRFGPLRLTASKRGLSGSVGAGPLRLTQNSSGRRTSTTRIPGTGVSWRRSRRR